MPKIRKPGYSKPSAKAPVIHPGDEAPFLVRRDEGVLDSSSPAC
jgi:hypothetical protein